MQIEIKLLEMMAKNNMRTVANLAEVSGLSRFTITKVLNNEYESITLQTLKKLCVALNCKFSQLVMQKED